jgi:hypothetical protein
MVCGALSAHLSWPAPALAQSSPSASAPASASASVPASPAQQDLAQLREEIKQLRAEVDALKLAMRDAHASSAAAPGQPTAPADLSLIPAQVQELAQVKVESQSKLPVKLFGTILSNTFVNSGEANWLENPNMVNRSASDANGSFSSTLRQSRLGVTVDGATFGSIRASGQLSMDFYGGAPAFETGSVMGLPRLLYAFVRLEGDKTAVEVGQDAMILAPRDPTSLAAESFPELFRAGNLYLRVPQARVEQKLGSHFTAIGGIVAPIAGDFNEDSFTFEPPAGAGERSRMPAFQGRFGYRNLSADESREVAFGVSGHYGRERIGGATESSWAGAADFNLQGAVLGAGGEIYYGKAIGQFGGSLGQFAKSAGGFIEGRIRASARASLNGGFGFDRLPDTEFLLLPRRENRSAFGNVIYHFTPEVAASIEYRWLSTLFAAGDRPSNNHVNFVMAYSF